jgi:hypothetical protein
MSKERMVKSATSLVLCAGMAMTTGCASIVSKSQYPVTINSNPSGATVTIKNKRGVDVQKATTPATVTLAASAGFFSPASYSFQFEKDGCFPASTSLSAGMDGWYIGNILFGGLIGILIVDPATGAMWKLDDTVYGNLSTDPNHKAVASAPTAPAVTEPTAQPQKETPQSVSDQLKQLKDLKESGVLTEDEYEAKRKALVEKL